MCALRVLANLEVPIDGFTHQRQQTFLLVALKVVLDLCCDIDQAIRKLALSDALFYLIGQLFFHGTRELQVPCRARQQCVFTGQSLTCERFCSFVLASEAGSSPEQLTNLETNYTAAHGTSQQAET